MNIFPPAFSGNFFSPFSSDIFLEKPFYEEALTLTSGYKPIMDKLVGPIEPLQIDPTSRFNSLSLLGAQVSESLQFILYLSSSSSSSEINLSISKTQIKVPGTESFVHSR